METRVVAAAPKRRAASAALSRRVANPPAHRLGAPHLLPGSAPHTGRPQWGAAGVNRHDRSVGDPLSDCPGGDVARRRPGVARSARGGSWPRAHGLRHAGPCHLRSQFDRSVCLDRGPIARHMAPPHLAPMARRTWRRRDDRERGGTRRPGLSDRCPGRRVRGRHRGAALGPLGGCGQHFHGETRRSATRVV